MSDSIFFDTAKLFRIPGSLQEHLIFLWLVGLWMLSKIVQHGKQKKGSRRKLTWVDFCVIGLLLISIFGVCRTVAEYYPSITGIMDEFMVQVSLMVSYFIIKDWFATNDGELIIEFLYCVVAVNTVAATLFILHQGLHFNIYMAPEYLTESVGGQTITRSFWFMPQFLFFSVAFLLVFNRKRRMLSLTMLLINAVAIIITYTISAIAIGIFISLLYFILTGLKEGKLGSAFGNIAKFAAAAVVGFILMSKILPSNITYLLSRINEHSKSEYSQREPNDLDMRLINTKYVLSKIAADKKVFGIGPVTKEQTEKVVELKANTADVAWSGVILNWGYAGLILFLAIFLIAGFSAFHLFLRSRGTEAQLALMLLLYIISQFFDSFVSWTFLSGHGFATGLWYFALLSAIPRIFAGERSNKHLKQLNIV